VEDRFGSFRASVRCQIPHSVDTGQFLYEASDLWFGYAAFDVFVDQLADTVRGRPVEACFHDLSDHSRLLIALDGDKGNGRISISEPLDCKARLEASFGCDQELAGVVLAKFREFPRWW
jgi:hypothetical protein